MQVRGQSDPAVLRRGTVRPFPRCVTYILYSYSIYIYNIPPPTSLYTTSLITVCGLFQGCMCVSVYVYVCMCIIHSLYVYFALPSTLHTKHPLPVRTISRCYMCVYMCVCICVCYTPILCVEPSLSILQFVLIPYSTTICIKHCATSKVVYV
jgi:hypothetical protein